MMGTLSQISQMWSLELRKSISGHDVCDRTRLVKLWRLTQLVPCTRDYVFYRNELSVLILRRVGVNSAPCLLSIGGHYFYA
jgi:hypothetical protein